jgi:predicted dehydrogenase
MPFTRELRRRYQAGDIGEVRYAEAEYLDEPADLAWFVGERARRGRGWAALLVVRLDNGAVLKSLHGFLEAGQQSWVRIHGDRGLMENLRHGDTRTLRVVWDAAGQEHGRAEEVYRPWPPEFPASTADPTGDGVAETLMLRDFAGAVRHQTPSPCLAPVVP